MHGARETFDEALTTLLCAQLDEVLRVIEDNASIGPALAALKRCNSAQYDALAARLRTVRADAARGRAVLLIATPEAPDA